MLKITLKDGSVKEFEGKISILELAKSISEGLARNACAGIVNGKVVDLRFEVEEDSNVSIVTFNDEEGQHAFRHTASHILAMAVKRLYPEAKLAIGPSIDDGFYYDIDRDGSFTNEEIENIEKEMKSIVKENLAIERFELPREEALKLMEEAGEPYKVELINDLPEGEIISFYKMGDFVDLCAGPHLMSTKPIKAFKLTQVAGAYWKGSEKNKMLTRIYGTAFTKASDLEEFLKMREEAKKRDHNKLGRELGLFTTSDVVGQGLPLLMPKGAKIVQLLQRWIEDEEESRGYVLTKTPFMAKSDLFKISGHWDHYKDGMFIIGDESDEDNLLALRPMTCPFQYIIYNAEQHSYRDLPIRYSETSTLCRNESSGEMHGLIRVRQFTLADGHIVCRPDQVKEEFKATVDLIKYIMTTLGIQDSVTYRFSKWDPNNTEKYIDNKEAWEKTQDEMREILNELELKYKEADGEAAFYGPKLDIQFKNVHGKEDTIITVQLDFALADRFDMSYVDADGSKKRPFIIHRSSIGCYERTLAMLIEKYAGAFPVWLCPTQAKVLPISDKYHDYAENVVKELKRSGIRVEADYRAEKIGYKIREARMNRIPYLLIVGEQEAENGTLAVKKRGEDLGVLSLEELKNRIVVENVNKEI
ncbi:MULTISPECIES: threonine--tRNA ligase [Clostridium]|uniref:Threonine--tRNA ligase n=1 Tax=Clostridium cadaveris TaxID=1529 RepID=A0A1I2L470_9CLOT|nr:threonine--tRNA ligase [Clostridium cadaveris]MDM8311587.1 threonine--tRNA ligase [Clostridium cadaveris]MDU4951614.1 threonine--tRNA ligase [Clostridium sp.]UFH64573.1 threonine--tRNA ligase [Clostridium cadaveris]SFF73348.1 threonyl-tRNA synthetase [Clostridium cadaveris]